MSDIYAVAHLALDIAVDDSSRERISRLVEESLDCIEPIEALSERVLAEFGDGSTAREHALTVVTSWLLKQKASADAPEHKFIAGFLAGMEHMDGFDADIALEMIEDEAAQAGVPLKRAQRIAENVFSKYRRQPERVAYHEAGHVVACFVLRRRIDGVSIIPDDESLGHVKVRLMALTSFPSGSPTLRDRKIAQDFLVTVLAGGLAEARFIGVRNYMGAMSDYARATNMDFQIEAPRTRQPYLDYVEALAEQLLDTNWHLVEALVSALLECTRMSGPRVRRVLGEARMDALPRQEPEETTA